MQQQEVNGESSVQRNQRGKIVHSGQRQIIVNLSKALEASDPNLSSQKIYKQISKQTGIGLSTIKNTIIKYKRSGTVSSPNQKKIRLSRYEKLTIEEKAEIRSIVHNIWFQNENPTLDKILIALSKKPETFNVARSTLAQILKKLGFKFRKNKRNCSLTDKTYTLLWRQKYIYTIQKYRTEGRPIYYLDEACLSTGETTVDSATDIANKDLLIGTPEPRNRGKRLIVFHIGSDKGFLKNGLFCFESNKKPVDYHDEISADLFFEWFTQIEPLLEKNAVIVIDNVPYHSKKIESRPTAAWSKEEIRSWLISKGQEAPEEFAKRSLLYMVCQIPREDSYAIDEYAKSRGKTILRLPPYHFNLNPMELAWSMVKQYVKRNNRTYKVSDVKQLLEEGLNRVTPDNWKNFISHVKHIEKKLAEMDQRLEESKTDSDFENTDDNDWSISEDEL